MRGPGRATAALHFSHHDFFNSTHAHNVQACFDEFLRNSSVYQHLNSSRDLRTIRPIITVTATDSPDVSVGSESLGRPRAGASGRDKQGVVFLDQWLTGIEQWSTTGQALDTRTVGTESAAVAGVCGRPLCTASAPRTGRVPAPLVRDLDGRLGPAASGPLRLHPPVVAAQGTRSARPTAQHSAGLDGCGSSRRGAPGPRCGHCEVTLSHARAGPGAPGGGPGGSRS